MKRRTADSPDMSYDVPTSRRIPTLLYHVFFELSWRLYFFIVETRQPELSYTSAYSPLNRPVPWITLLQAKGTQGQTYTGRNFT